MHLSLAGNVWGRKFVNKLPHLKIHNPILVYYRIMTVSCRSVQPGKSDLTKKKMETDWKRWKRFHTIYSTKTLMRKCYLKLDTAWNIKLKCTNISLK